MILAEKIIYLRKRCGWSQEELAERLDVSRQAISKWEGAQAAPDMNRILRLSDIFGVSTDYLLRDELGPEDDSAPPVPNDREAPEARTVSMEEADAFLSMRNRYSGRIALGVMLCILSPVPLILTAGAQAAGLVPLTEEHAALLGLIPLFLMVAGAVALFITQALRAQRYKYLENEDIDTAYGVSGMVRERLERYRAAHGRMLTAGVVLCVLSAIPSVAAGVMGEEAAMLAAGAVALTLILVALGVLLIVKCSLTKKSFQMLLEEGEYSRAEKLENRKNAGIAAIYWSAAIAIYLIWSFITMRWDISWVVWPISGVLYGALCAVLRIVRQRA